MVIIWFGFAQFSDASSWVGYLPEWTSSLPISATTFIYLNAWFEMTFGLLLLTGFYTRIVALLLALHLLEITYTVGYGAIGIRDFGLSVALLSIAMYGPSIFSLDRFFKSRTEAMHIPNIPESLS